MTFGPAIALSVRYAVSALAAGLCNLAAQRLALGVYDAPGALLAALALGTGVGLAVKYLLDKCWIFGDRSSGLATHTMKFFLYTVMGLATTAIFWGTEAAFWALWRTDPMRELGAAIGLAVGYVVKYQLDKRYVFRNPGAAEGLA